MRPLRGKIIVENISDIRQTASGLWLAESVKEVPHRGKIVAMGSPFIDEKGKEHPWQFEMGEVVHFKRQWNKNQDKHYVIKNDDVFAVEDKDGKLRSVRDLIIVRRVYTGKVENSSIVIPETFGIQDNHEDFYGLVVNVGIEDKFGIQEGMKILYHRNEGLEVRLPNREEFWALKPRAILAELVGD